MIAYPQSGSSSTIHIYIYKSMQLCKKQKKKKKQKKNKKKMNELFTINVKENKYLQFNVYLKYFKILKYLG